MARVGKDAKAAAGNDDVDVQATVSRKPTGKCAICNFTGYVPYHHVSKNGKRISNAVALCKCEMGQWRAELHERRGERVARYFEDLPRELACTDLNDKSEIDAWNRVVYAGLAEKMGLGYDHPETHKWIPPPQEVGEFKPETLSEAKSSKRPEKAPKKDHLTDTTTQPSKTQEDVAEAAESTPGEDSEDVPY